MKLVFPNNIKVIELEKFVLSSEKDLVYFKFFDDFLKLVDKLERAEVLEAGNVYFVFDVNVAYIYEAK